MTKPRLIVPIIEQFSVRYILRTGLLRRMAEYTQPIALITMDDAELKGEIENAGAEVHKMPAVEFGSRYRHLQQMMDLWHIQRLKSPTTAIDERRRALRIPRRQYFKRRLRNCIYNASLRMPGAIKALLKREEHFLWQDTNVAEFDRLLTALQADALFSVTSVFTFERLLLHAAHHQQMPMCMASLSFDHITTRGRIPVTFDEYYMWNHYNEAELCRVYPEAATRKRVVVGAPQLDFYWDESYIWDEATWRKELNLPPERTVILYGAGSATIVPHEPLWVRQLDEAIQAGEIPGKPLILLRRHPNDSMERWRSLLNVSRHVVFDDPWKAGREISGLTGLANIKRYNIEKLASTLRHCAVHLSASSTMSLDGAILDRPQVGPAYDDQPGRKFDRMSRELYQREHYLPITHSGGLAIVYSRQAMVDAVRTGLENPSKGAEGRRRLVREICTYADGKCTDRLNNALKTYFRGS